MDCSTPVFPVFHHLLSLLKLMSTEPVMPSKHLILSHPLLLPSIFPSIRVFSNKSTLHIRWPKYCSFSFNISPSNEYSGLISFGIDWFDHLAVQGTLKNLLNTTVKEHQFFGTHASLWSSSHPHMTTGKTIPLTTRTFVGKVMSLLFNMLSTFVIVFFSPKSKGLLISWLKSPSVVILEPKKIKSLTVFIVFSIYLPWSDRTICHDLCFLSSKREGIYAYLWLIHVEVWQKTAKFCKAIILQ